MIWTPPSTDELACLRDKASIGIYGFDHYHLVTGARKCASISTRWSRHLQSANWRQLSVPCGMATDRSFAVQGTWGWNSLITNHRDPEISLHMTWTPSLYWRHSLIIDPTSIWRYWHTKDSISQTMTSTKQQINYHKEGVARVMWCPMVCFLMFSIVWDDLDSTTQQFIVRLKMNGAAAQTEGLVRQDEAESSTTRRHHISILQE